MCIGDIIGRTGRKLIRAYLPFLFETYSPDLIIANGENAAGGIGLTGEIADELFQSPIDIVTSGNHIWQHNEIKKYFKQNNRLLRPLNYPDTAPGKGYILYEKKGVSYLVLNFQGVIFMDPVYPPFQAFERAPWFRNLR